jgi:hypothetical protein
LILHVQPDGNVLAIVHDPRGGEHSRHVMTPDQFHHYLIGPATSFDHVIENGVGHNLGIATGRPTPRQPDHPADPIHKVRQVLQHTRKMFGVDKIGQAPPRVGYAVGGPVRVDDTLPPDPAWTTQDERDNPPPPDAPDDRQPLWEQFARKHFGYGDVPDVGTEPVPSDDEADRTPLYQQWAQKHLGPIKDTIASYLGGANAASPQEVDSTLQGVAEQNPGLTIPETVQRAVAEQNPSLNASGTTSGDDRTVGTGYGGAQTNQPSSNDNREEFFRRLMADRDKAVSQYVIQAPGSRAQSSSLLPETGLLSSTDTKTGKVTETPLGMRQREAAQTPSLHEFLNPKPAVAGALPAPPKMTGNKAVDEHNIAIWKEQAIAARGSISQQNAATAIQQRAATAAEAGMSRDAIAVLRNIQAKGGAETDDEKFVEREYTTRVRQNLEKMKGQGGGQAQAGGQQRVKVGSIAEARKLPSGTLITLPDGSPGQVP